MVNCKLHILAFQVRGTHHHAQKIRSFCSNIVELTILTRFFNSNQNRVCRYYVPAAGNKNNNSWHDFVNETTFLDAELLCVMCFPSCIVFVQNLPSTWHIPTFASVLNQLEI